MVRSAFVDPVFFILVAGLGGLIAGLRWRALGFVVVLFAFLGLYALSTEYVSSQLLALAEPAPTPQPAVDTANPPGAIVVLSGSLRKAPATLGGDMIGEDTLERVRMAADLARRTHLPVLVSGGKMPGSAKTLARTMSESLTRDFGITATWEEDRSQTTFENAAFSAPILAAAGIDRIYLVTHAAHMPRAVEIFEHQGLKVTPVPTGFTVPVDTLSAFSLVPRAVYLADSGRGLRELLGVRFYRLVYE